jgi:YidC/Oxa1 family membrane protein insertase
VHRSCTGSSRSIATPPASWWIWCRPTFPAPSRTLSLCRPTNARDTARLNTALYRVTGDTNGVLDVTKAKEPLVFEFQDENGLAARKEFRFDATSYTLTATISARRGTSPLNPAIQWGPASATRARVGRRQHLHRQRRVASASAAASRREGGAPDADKAAEAPVQQGPFRFIGVDDHYFVAFVVNDLNGSAEFKPLTLPGDATTAAAPARLHAQAGGAGTGDPFYVGPKQFDELQRLGPDYVRAIDFGMFAWLVVPLLGTLKWLYRFTGNYGWSIILLTIIINLVMFPLRHKSSVSMRKLQAVQPQMKAIQDRYSHLKMTDPGRQKMQEEVSALYKEKGVNPAAAACRCSYAAGALGVLFAALAVGRAARRAVRGMDPRSFRTDPYFVLPR